MLGLTRNQWRALQVSLDRFDRKFKLGHPSLVKDGVPGKKTLDRILTEAYYLGYGDNRREIIRDHDKLARFVHRLRHPKDSHYLPLSMRRTARKRRRHRRHVLARHRSSGIGRVLTLYRWCQAIHNAGTSYLWGGGHSGPLSRYSVRSRFDCSGSISYALRCAGLYHDAYARVSSGFEHWGGAGRGRWHAIYCNWEHIWLRFFLPGKAWRFDTSPQGCGSHGPRLRWCARFTSSFYVRHVPGL